MTNDQWESIIKFAILVFGASVPITVSIWKYFNAQEVKLKESSFGAKRVKELEDMIENVQDEIKLLKIMIDNFKEKLDDLSKEYKELMKHITSSYLGTKQ